MKGVVPLPSVAMGQFDHERMDVYGVALSFVSLADELIAHLPRGRSYVADQLQRAALSITNNIAEGAGEFAPDEKKRFYRIARRSATECAALLDVMKVRDLAASQPLSDGREHLLRVVSMLTRLVQPKFSGKDTRTGSGKGAGC